MDNQERTRRSVLITMGGKRFYETYLKFNKHHDDEYPNTEGYEKPVTNEELLLQ